MVDPSHQALAGLLRATSASPAEKARALEQALVSARGRSPEACLATDAEATDILWDRRTGDALLEHISLDVLGDLVSAWVSRLECGGGARLPPMEQRRPAWRLLDVLRRSSLLCRIRAADAVDEWAGPWA
jgi:hypothetical protein